MPPDIKTTIAKPRRHEAPFLRGATAIGPELAKKVIEKALERGGEFSELYFEYRRSNSLFMEDGLVRTAGGGIDMGVGIRVVHGSAVGFAYSESLEPADMLRAAVSASRIAAGSGPTRSVAAVRRKRIKNNYPVGPRGEVVDVAGQARVELMRKADVACRAASPKIKRVDVVLVAVHKELLIVSSAGTMVADIQPMMRFSVSTVAKRGQRTESGSSSGGGRCGLDYFEGVAPETHGEEAARVALLNLDARPTPAGIFPVILAAGDSGILLHEAVGHGLEADFNRKATSNYSGRMGQRVASKLVSVVDDPGIAGSRGSINIDDEGELPARDHLIRKGKLVGYLHDRISASHYSRKRSGSGRRQSFRHVPLPRMSNTYMPAGEDDPEDILKSVKFGIYARRFSGGQVNISKGDFVFSLVEGYLIEDGRITAPLEGVNLIGNGPDVLEKVSMVGHDFELSDGMWTCGKDGQSVPVGVGMPTVKIDAITVGGTEVGQ